MNMLVFFRIYILLLSCHIFPSLMLFVCLSIHMVHDEVKDKSFELEMSWIGEGWKPFNSKCEKNCSF